MTEEKTEEISSLILALSSTNEDTFKYKGSTYVRVTTTASTAEAPSLNKAIEKKYGHRESYERIKDKPIIRKHMSSEQMAKMVEKHNGNSVSGAHAPDSAYSKILPSGGFKRNEMVVLSATGKSKQNQDIGRGFVWRDYSNDHPRYCELIETHPAVKEAVLEMQAAVDRSPFKGVIGVGIREYGATIWVFRNYASSYRFVNRVKAYSESYERLRKHLVPTQFIK